MANCAFIGLGVMGYEMAGHLAKSGHKVRVYNRTQAVANNWANQFPGSSVATPRLAAENAEFVFVCVGNDDDVRSVVYGEDGVLVGMSQDTVLIDHTTASAELARELHAACKSKGVCFIDAPVSGGQQGAQNGALTVMVGGEQLVCDRVAPVASCFARSFQRIGDVGAGQQCKMVNQICIAGVVQGLAEGLHFAKKAGLDRNKVIDVISKGAAQSWQMENRHQTMIDQQYEHGFAVDWMRKDLGIVLDEASCNGASLPLTALVDQFYSEVQRMGGGRFDTSSLLARLEQYDD